MCFLSSILSCRCQSIGLLKEVLVRRKNRKEDKAELLYFAAALTLGVNIWGGLGMVALYMELEVSRDSAGGKAIPWESKFDNGGAEAAAFASVVNWSEDINWHKLKNK